MLVSWEGGVPYCQTKQDPAFANASPDRLSISTCIITILLILLIKPHVSDFASFQNKKLMTVAI